MLASEVMDEAAALMNDAQKFTWGYPICVEHMERWSYTSFLMVCAI